MNDDPLATRRHAPAGDRAEQVLRRGGVVEHPAPPHVWDALVCALHGVQQPGRPTLVSVTPPPGRGTESRRPKRGGARRGALRLLAAAAVGALVAWTGTALGDADARGDLLASGPLEALSDDGAQGRAEVVTVDGRQRLRVELTGRPDAADGYLEVWLLRPDVSGMVTLGVLEGEAGEFLLPPGLDLAEYAVVDISREHLDGDPEHGGDSLVRGQVG